MLIDTTFDFTSDSPGYWDGFWTNRNGLCAGNCDPDTESLTLQKYHQVLWSRKLPCGKRMDLTCGTGSHYLFWDKYRFGSDSIMASFQYERCRALHDQLRSSLPDYQGYIEDFIHRTYTIGGMIIFPKHTESINQMRGRDPRICDRWDLTLECIRRFYLQEDSPLFQALERDRDFFELFVDFKGYVDFFFFQDCVDESYQQVDIWLGDAFFETDPLPKGVEEYLHWMERQLDFLERRNARIAAFLCS